MSRQHQYVTCVQTRRERIQEQPVRISFEREKDISTKDLYVDRVPDWADYWLKQGDNEYGFEYQGAPYAGLIKYAVLPNASSTIGDPAKIGLDTLKYDKRVENFASIWKHSPIEITNVIHRKPRDISFAPAVSSKRPRRRPNRKGSVSQLYRWVIDLNAIFILLCIEQCVPFPPIDQ